MRAILFFVFCCFLSGPTVAAYEENNNFCIHTEPLLLTDIEKHVNPVKGDPRCEVLATTMTTKEKESFLHTMCKQLGNQNKEIYQYFKLRNGELTGRGTHVEICNGSVNPFLAWVPYEMIQRNFAQELNPKERVDYIAKATDVDHNKTELCHFRHSDIVTNISSSLFTCAVMIFEDNFYGLDSHINVLIEIQPIMYELKNITYLPWINVTTSYKTLLGKTSLKNPSREPKQIYGSINYAYVEKVKLNTTSVYNKELEKLPLLFEHKGAVLELDGNGVGGVDVKDKYYFGRIMDPKTTVKVEIIGQWAEHRQEFTANVYEYFGYAIKRFRHEMHDGHVSFMLIESAEPVYEMPESSLLVSSSVHNDLKSQRFTQGEDTTSTPLDEEWNAETFTARPRGGHPYPEFYPWFVAGAIIVGVVLLAAIMGMVRSCGKNEEEHKYKIADNSP